jgi:DNA invertase Pin-like site-specific DNA recombinase
MEAQGARASAWAQANGYALAETFSDAGISGKRTVNRPGLQRALTAVCGERGNVLIVYSLSRLARSTKDAIAIAERLEKAGADLVSLTERIDTTTAAGKMVFRMLAVLAEFERDLVSERTKAALAHKSAKGERVGGVPYGFRLADDGVRLLADLGERDTRADLRALRQGGMTWQAVADDLNSRGILTKTGRRWTWQTTRKIAA